MALANPQQQAAPKGQGNKKKEIKNEAAVFAARMMTSQIAQSNGLLWNDYQLLTKGHAVYLPHFFCAKDDYTLLKSLTSDLEKHAGSGMINWSQHLKHENPTFSSTFQGIVKRLEDYFDVDIFATRLNFYPDASSWKPFHHDSHAYGGHAVREDFTMGASFGATRELVFMHPPTQQQFSFPQQNGDVFSFTTTVNQRFMHGVPRAQAVHGPAPRFSVIAWGKRRTLNSRNAGSDEIQQQKESYKPNRPAANSDAKPAATSTTAAMSSYPEPEKEKEIAMEIKQVTELVEQFVISQTQQKAKPAAPAPTTSGRSRVQGGWASNQLRGGKQGARPNMRRGDAAAVVKSSAPARGGWAAAMGAQKVAQEAEDSDDEDEDDEENGDE